MVVKLNKMQSGHAISQKMFSQCMTSIKGTLYFPGGDEIPDIVLAELESLEDEVVLKLKIYFSIQCIKRGNFVW